MVCGAWILCFHIPRVLYSISIVLLIAKTCTFDLLLYRKDQHATVCRNLLECITIRKFTEQNFKVCCFSAIFSSCFSFVFFVRRAVFVAILHNCSTFEFICSECLLCEQPQTSQRFIHWCNSHVCKSECAMHCTHTATLTQVFVIWGVLFIFQTA